MSGVIDDDGQQWERCNECGEFTKLEELGFQPFSEKWQGPCDICIACANKAPNIEDIEPGRSWIAQYAA